jgi:hypothetical protein
MDALGGIRFGSAITAAARAHGLDPKLLAAVAAQETGGPGSNSGRNVVGDGGHGHGLFQIDDRTWAFGASAAAMDPAANANAAAGILADDLARSGGDVRAALSTYNSGSPTGAGTKTTWADGATLGYADSVLRHYAALGGDPAQVLADNRTTASSVNALAGFTRAQPLANATAGPFTNGAAGPLANAATGPSANVTAGTLLDEATGALADPAAGTLAWTQQGSAASAASSGTAAYPPPVVTPTSQTPFAAPVSWANETSASGPAGGKLAADADSLVASEVDSVDDDDATSQA